MPPESQQLISQGQMKGRVAGVARSVLILDDPMNTTQFRRIAKETGIDGNERYIDASTVPDWKKVGMDWIINGVEPDE